MKLNGIISEKHQIMDDRMVLTVGKIYRCSSSSFDFGGSEYQEAKLEEIKPEKRESEDKYGWWNLDQGYYIAEFNEGVEIPEGKAAVLQPWSDRFPASATHPTRILRRNSNKIRIILMVSEAGIKIKENSRFSELVEL